MLGDELIIASLHRGRRDAKCTAEDGEGELYLYLNNVHRVQARQQSDISSPVAAVTLTFCRCRSIYVIVACREGGLVFPEETHKEATARANSQYFYKEDFVNESKSRQITKALTITPTSQANFRTQPYGSGPSIVIDVETV